MAELSAEQLEELRETFEYNDVDGDGSIELQEFIQMLDELEAGISIDEARVGFHTIDSDDDGRIDFDEFIAWWCNDE